MDRRGFLKGSLGAAILGPLWPDTLTAQTGAAPGQSAAEILAAYKPAPVTRKLVLDANSRSLHWLRSPDDVAQAAIEMVCGGVCPTVGSHPAHVDAATVTRALPAFAKQVRSPGLRVTLVKGPAITDLTEPHAEAIVGAVAQAGCSHYSLGGYQYDLAKPLAPQLDAVKRRLERFVRLNQKHGITLVYDTVAGATSVGGLVLDLLPIMRGFDPKFIGFQWDTGHMALHGDGMWETLMRHAAPYIAAVGWRDRGWVQDLGLKGEGGPYPGPNPRVEPLVTLPDGRAIPGPGMAPGSAPPAGRGAPGGGRGRGRGGGGGGGDDEPQGGRRGGPARGPANSAGAGSIDASNPVFRTRDGEMPKRPIGGMNAKGAGWSAPNVPMGMGVLHIPRLAALLVEIGFNGPTVLQSEYAGIGGAESGADKITAPRQFVIGRLKRDVITIRKSFEMANTGVAI